MHFCFVQTKPFQRNHSVKSQSMKCSLVCLITPLLSLLSCNYSVENSATASVDSLAASPQEAPVIARVYTTAENTNLAINGRFIAHIPAGHPTVGNRNRCICQSRKDLSILPRDWRRHHRRLCGECFPCSVRQTARVAQRLFL